VGNGQQQRDPELRLRFPIWDRELLQAVVNLAQLASENSTDEHEEFFRMTLEAQGGVPATPEAPAIGDEAQKRTFFLVDVSANEPTIKERFTGIDARQTLIVEQVDARLTGKPITMDQMVERFPDAVRSAHYFAVMKTQQKADPAKLAGPFILVSKHKPTDKELLTWFNSSKDRIAASGQNKDERLQPSVEAVMKATAKAKAKAKRWK
jgi:hypothetical protein